MNELYGNDCPHCGGFRDEESVDIVFDADVLARMLREIYGGLDVRDAVQRDAFEETLRIFNRATAEGLSQAAYQDYDDLFLEQLRTNNEVFSAFRVHRMQNDMAARLLDGNGRLKPFDRWAEDVRDISSHYAVSWLRTEYATAVIRARQAAEWKGFRAEADVLPNLRWMPTTSPEPDNLHRQYWQARLTLPVGHPFWEQHRPGDRWNCKCSLRQTGEPATAEAVAGFSPVPPAPGLDGNPADDGRLFSASHPYFTKAHPGAKEAVEEFLEEEVHYTLIPTQRGRLRIHDGHGKNEREENIRVGKYLAEKHGYDIDLQDNPQNKPSADSYNRTLGVFQEYKVNSTPTKNSIDRLIRDGKNQADDIVLWIDSDISLGDLRNAITSRVRRAENIQTLTIIRGDKDVSYKREDILRPDWIIRQADFH